MDYSLHILIIGCTAVLAWWIRREVRELAQRLGGILVAMRDILEALVRQEKK